MTSHTPNLGLMSPVLSDPFNPDDFRSTFGIIDQNPGVLVIPNQASLPTGWSNLQHGRMVWQADLNVMWVWVQPSAIVAGSWSRMGTFGWLGGARNSASVGTTAISTATAPVVVSATVMIPGGRPVMIMYDWLFLGNDPAKFVTLNLVSNSGVANETRHNGNSFGNAYSSGYPYPPDSGTYFFIRPATGVQENVNFQLKIRCQDPAVVGDVQGGGSAFIINTGLNIIEI